MGSPGELRFSRKAWLTVSLEKSVNTVSSMFYTLLPCFASCSRDGCDPDLDLVFCIAEIWQMNWLTLPLAAFYILIWQ